MDIFNALTSFVAVVNEGAFSRAARKLGVATSSVTRQVDSLEQHLNALLINRSTRRLTLTDVGMDYYDSAVQIIQDLSEANANVTTGSGKPRGPLRVNLPVAFGELHIAPKLPKFLKLYPDIELDVTFTDEIVNLTEDRTDVAVRLGQIETTSLIARRIGSNQRVVCASQEYIQQHGEPKQPIDLLSHNCLTFNYSRSARFWTFQKEGAAEKLRIRGNLRANNSIALKAAVQEGVGIGLLPVWLLKEDLRSGILRQLLHSWQVAPTAPGDVHAIYLPSRRGSTKVRVFVDFLLSEFGSSLDWSSS
ncbi:MAG: LysR family transcriptional regulator [Rhizobium sp.]|jgi:DNA-binding transcriptional LysR family regulator|uniref:LysR family transcriptional regulator n=1 Tax=Rhizobium sp. TaxID=391 RepID=UPI00056AD2B8